MSALVRLLPLRSQRVRPWDKATRQGTIATSMLEHKVCILNEDEVRSLTYTGIAHRCSSRRHRHFDKQLADALVKAGELVWLGKHKRLATFLNARSWVKTYTRNEYGEVISCVMQLVPGGGGF